MKRTIYLVLLLIGLVLSAPANQSVLAASHQQGGTVSKSFGDPGDAYLEFTLSGADFVETSANFYQGEYSGGAITLSGTAIVTRAEGYSSWMIVDARMGDQAVHYPPPGDEGLITGTTFDYPFSLSFTVPPNYPYNYVDGGVRLDVCGEWNCGTYEIGFQVNIPEDSVQPASGLDSETTQTGSSIGLPGLVIAIMVLGVGGVVIVGGFTIAKIASTALKKPPIEPKPVISDPEVANAIRAWEQVAKQADLEADKYIQQWEAVSESGDSNDPEYQALRQKYQEYIEDQRQQAAEARQQAQEIDELEQQYQQELHQQQAYRQHRQVESKFIQQESQRQAQRQGAFDRQIDQTAQEQQLKLEQLKTERKAYRDELRKELIKARQAVDQATTDQYIAAGVIPGILEKIAIGTKYTADFSIDVIAQVAPGTKPVKVAYKFLSGAGEGAGEAWADKENWKSHVAMGLKKGTVDAVVYVIKDKPLNYVPTRVRNFVKPQWVNLPESTKVLSVKRNEWLKGVSQALISKVRGKANPIIRGGDYMKGLKF